MVKIGTRALTTSSGILCEDRITSLANDILTVIESGKQVVLVSSGAVGAGIGQLGIDQRPTDLGQLQAVASVGQSHLVQSYDQAFKAKGHHAAQILLTAEDIDNRTRYLNVRNTILSLFEFGAVPIINENDTVAVEELQTTFGDNDRLAALVTNLLSFLMLMACTIKIHRILEHK